MTIIVKKFGGTSVGDFRRIRSVAQKIREFCSGNPEARLVLVASAMAGETDRLLGLARSMSPSPSAREMDMLVATGEQSACALLAIALEECGVPAVSLNAFQVPVSTDPVHGGAHVAEIGTERIYRELESGRVPVITGFQGVHEGEDLTTLGRGGSDISAVAVAAALKASSCYIYTDVPGVYSSDPRVVQNARLIPIVTYAEMLELASLGAKVLHPRSVFFAMRYKVPLAVLSSFEPGSGTWVIDEEQRMERPSVVGITYRLDEAKLTIERVRGTLQPLKAIFAALADQKISIDMITQTGHSDGTADIGFSVLDEHSERALNALQPLAPSLGARGVLIERDVARISIIGSGIKYHADVAARIFSLLAEQSIDVRMIATSDIRISLVVPRKFCEVAVRTLHDGLIDLSETPGTLPAAEG